ncbi:MAG TPA: hypothetical protein VK694_01525 [Verrucomicrobiae bacterium]|nr:hypothetical protein [Verrucomicrobiae bacterium]
MMHHAFLLLAQLDATDVNGLPQGDLTNTTFQTGLRIVFGIAGGAALVILGYGAFQYVISQGNPQSINKAKNTIIDALIGLIIIIFAFSIISFVVSRIR